MEFEAPMHCTGKKVHKRFCIDKYEYPNKEGVRPTVMNDFPWPSASAPIRGNASAPRPSGRRPARGPSTSLSPTATCVIPPFAAATSSASEPKSLGKDAKGRSILAFASRDKAIRVAELERLWEGVP